MEAPPSRESVMTQKTQPIIPYLTVDNASVAVEFYVKAFGAKEVRRQAAPGSTKLLHVELVVNGGTLMLSDDFPEFHGGKASSAKAIGATPVTIHLTSENAEQLFNQGVKAGAQVLLPFADKFWGAKYGQLTDPFGFRWSISTPDRPMTEDQLQKGAERAMGAKA